MNKAKTHYELLGLSPTATPEEIKKRFRALARQYHPDVNPDRPESHELFLRINQAYDILSDPSKRARYDLDLRDRARREAEARSGSFGSAPLHTRPRPNAPPRPGSAPPSGAAASPRAGADRRRQEAERRRLEVKGLLEDAHQAYRRGHLREAERLAQAVLELGRIGPAHELLGDIYARQGRSEQAVESYTLAAQMIPTNGHIMAKLNREAARLAGRQGTYPDLSWTKGVPAPPSPRQLSYQLAVSFIGAAVVLLVMFLPFQDASRLPPPLGHWTLVHLARLGITGLLAGALLAVAAWVRPIDQELFYPTVSVLRGSLPLGLILAVLGALFLPVALVAYAVMGARSQVIVSRSVLLLLTVVVALTFGFWLQATQMLPDAAGETLFFGGNLLLLSALCGWFIGDLFRPAWAT